LPELQDLRFRIVGKGSYEAELRSMAKNLGVEKRVEWLKDLSRKELLECYASADVFLMLSSHEAYGITVAEALAAGTPCIVAKGSALEEFVDGKACVGIEMPVTAKKVVTAVKDLKKGKRKKQNGSKSVMDWEEVAERTIKVYEYII
jgi:glycosyltransferase involved in cell wall biosynthesis